MLPGRFTSVTPGMNVVAIVLLGIVGLMMNGGLRRLPADPPPRRALWNMPALECSTILPSPVRSQLKPTRGSGAGASTSRKPRGTPGSVCSTRPFAVLPVPGT